MAATGLTQRGLHHDVLGRTHHNSHGGKKKEGLPIQPLETDQSSLEESVSCSRGKGSRKKGKEKEEVQPPSVTKEGGLRTR